jgi:hypothetical protein
VAHFYYFRLPVLLAFSCIASSVAWAQAPSFTTQVPGVANHGSSVFILLPLVNSGTATATSVRITSITLGTLKPTTPSSLPLSMGTIGLGAVSFANLAFNDTSLITGNVYTLTAHGTYLFNAVTSTFSVSRSIKFGVPTVFQLPASPLTVTATPDPSHAARKMISAKLGGTITAHAASGAIFTLTIPANALLSDAPVTLTPLINVSGLPISNGFVAGVEVTPDELELMHLAKLTIQPPISIAINQQVGFSFHGSGQEFFFYPLDVVSSISFSIHQFNAYGLGFGSITKTPIPTDMFDRLENELEPINASQRTALPLAVAASLATESVDQAASTTSSNFATQWADMLQTQWDQVIGPQLQAAEGPGGTLDSDSQALVKALNWGHWVMVSDLDNTQPTTFGKELTQVMAALPVVFKKDFAEAFGLCSAAPGPESVSRLVAITRGVAFIGDDPATVLGSDYLAKINDCASELTFDFDSEIKGTFNPPNADGIKSDDSAVQASGLAMTWCCNSTSDPLAGSYQVQNGKLTYVKVSITDGSATVPGAGTLLSCSSVLSTPPGTIAVSAAPAIYRFGKPPFGNPPPFSMIVKIQEPNIAYHVKVAFIEPGNPACITFVSDAPAPFYGPEFFLVGGTNEFVMPLNSVKSFTPPRTGTRCSTATGACISATEVNTTVTLNGP